MIGQFVSIGSAEWNASEGLMCLPERLTIEVLPGLLKKENWLKFPVKQVDFSKVSKADSAILAVLLSWSANTEQQLTVINLPADLQTLVNLYDLENEFSYI